MPPRGEKIATPVCKNRANIIGDKKLSTLLRKNKRRQ
jgi:hypothetical protein